MTAFIWCSSINLAFLFQIHKIAENCFPRRQVVDNLPDDHIVKTKYLRPCYGDPPGGDDEEATNNEQLHNDEQLHRDEQLHNNEHAGNKKHNASEAETTGNEENPAKS